MEPRIDASILALDRVPACRQVISCHGSGRGHLACALFDPGPQWMIIPGPLYRTRPKGCVRSESQYGGSNAEEQICQTTGHLTTTRHAKLCDPFTLLLQTHWEAPDTNLLELDNTLKVPSIAHRNITIDRNLSSAMFPWQPWVGIICTATA